MNKIFTFAVCCALLPGASLAADASSFYEDILINDEIKSQTEAKRQKQAQHNQIHKVQKEAAKLLESDLPPINVKIDGLPSRPQVSEALQKRAEVEKLSPAPFGLNWGATILDTRDLGVTLTPIGEKDYVNNFSAGNLPKSLNGFRSIDLTFGIENELWRIIAYGDFMQDTPDAAMVLRQYRRFYQLLERKYGNAQQFFTPQPTTETLQQSSAAQETPKVDNSIGNPHFLAQLQSGEAELYATFEGHDIGAALSVNVDGSGQSYIVIDYKNLKILRQREEQALDTL